MSDATLITELADCRQCYDVLATKFAAEQALVEEASRTIAELHKQVSELRAEREWLVKLLSRYGHHDKDCELHCEANLPGDSRCTCGFSASLT